MTAATSPTALGIAWPRVAVLAVLALVVGPAPVAAAPGPGVPEVATPAVPLGVATSGVATSGVEAPVVAADPTSDATDTTPGPVDDTTSVDDETTPVATPTIAPEVRPAVRLEPPVGSAVGPLSRPVVVLYGDSLAWEAQGAFVASFADHPDVDVVTHTFGGTAICDWLGQMAADAARLRPGAVVVEFSGNNFTPCMQDASGAGLTGDAYAERYAADAATVIATFAPGGTQVVFASGPLTRVAADAGGRHDGGLNAMYADLARHHAGVHFADAGAAVLDGDRWTETLPCLPNEPCTGGADANGQPVNVVRAPDGIHFCPASGDAVDGVTGACAVWSSGAFRYGTALAAPVVDALDAAEEV